MIKIKNDSKKKILLALTVIVLAVGFTTLYIVKNGVDKSTSIDTVNYDPPTEEEKKQADENKAQNDVRDAKFRDQSTQQSSIQSIKPVITYAGQYGEKIEVGSQVPEIFEEGGICTASFSKDGQLVTKQVNAVREGSSTFCPMFIATASEFSPKGTWDLTVSYSSNISQGTSEKSSLEIK